MCLKTSQQAEARGQGPSNIEPLMAWVVDKTVSGQLAILYGRILAPLKPKSRELEASIPKPSGKG